MTTRFDMSDPPRTVEVNTAVHIARGKVLVVGVSLSAGVAAGSVILYDGENNVSPVLLRMTAIIGDTVGQGWTHGILFEHGLFAAVSAVTLFATISYYTGIDEHETKPLNGAD